MDDQVMNLRIAALEARMASLEHRLAFLEGGAPTPTTKRRKKDLSLEERQQIRARLVAGQEKARARREAEAAKNRKQEA